MEKNKESIWFWLIAISLMVFAMCVLSLQIIELHQKSNTTEFVVQHNALPTAVSQDAPRGASQDMPQKFREEENVGETEEQRLPGRHMRAIRSKAMRTPKSMRKIDRVLYDVPFGNNSLLWVILRGLMPDDRFISMYELRDLQRLIMQCASEMGWGQLSQEIMSMFDGSELPDMAMSSRIACALKCDIIFSTSEKNRGYDICTKDGEIFHGDSVNEFYKEACDKATIWAHLDVDKKQWAAAVQEKENLESYDGNGDLKNQEKHKVFFLIKA
ncbi:MAG: hypothetical protein LBH08_03365 [Puniceicoccales bacterium]|nr:hypothetical protein [Puniceicoccales bacterium]